MFWPVSKFNFVRTGYLLCVFALNVNVPELASVLDFVSEPASRRFVPVTVYIYIKSSSGSCHSPCFVFSAPIFLSMIQFLRLSIVQI